MCIYIYIYVIQHIIICNLQCYIVTYYDILPHNMLSHDMTSCAINVV